MPLQIPSSFFFFLINNSLATLGKNVVAGHFTACKELHLYWDEETQLNSHFTAVKGGNLLWCQQQILQWKQQQNLPTLSQGGA